MRWPAGAGSSGTACGIKRAGELDLGLLVLDRSSTWAGTFTRNAAAAAPVLWCRSKLGGPARALVVNSGNANACTGSAGAAAVREAAAAVASRIGCSSDEVLVASTGPIAVALPTELIVNGLSRAFDSLEASTGGFADSILTTDTTRKVAASPAGSATVVGVAKGAAMLAPNMATMLAFVITDAEVDQPTLQKVLDVAVDRSFNRISVDACESTNDSVFLFATGAAGECDVDRLAEATTEVCKELAEAMVKDAEGGSKMIRIAVEGASDESAACGLARAVAESALWRAAAYGNDPNWGRILSALGSADRSLDLARVSVTIGKATVFSAGEPSSDPSAALPYMKGPEISVTCTVGAGAGAAEFLTSDLTPDYVVLNAEGTT